MKTKNSFTLFFFRDKIINKIFYFVLSVVLTLITTVYILFLMQGTNERQFLLDLEEKIDTDTAKVMISEIVNNDWETVCLIDRSAPKKEAYGINVNRINFYYALVFLKNDEIIRALYFKPERLTFDGFVMPKVSFNQQDYRFLSKYSENCFSRDKAIFKAEVLQTGCCGNSYEIIFSGN